MNIYITEREWTKNEAEKNERTLKRKRKVRKKKQQAKNDWQRKVEQKRNNESLQDRKEGSHESEQRLGNRVLREQLWKCSEDLKDFRDL